MFSIFDDTHFMREALKEARLAFDADEVPVGAVVVWQNRIIARAHNRTECLNDVTAHAEILALTAAADFLGTKYLNECALFVTLEPCVMCGGALHWAQLGKLVYGAADEKQGYLRVSSTILHPKTNIAYGIMEAESRELLQLFFRNKRR